MKTFKEYLAESKKIYQFKIKVAGELPEDFQDKMKSALDRCKVSKFEKVSTTPIQALPLDFPTMKNCEVHVFETICEYPITSPEIAAEIKTLGVAEEKFRVRGSGEPSEIDQILSSEQSSGEALLNDSSFKDSPKVKAKDYFGDDFNRSFLKDLQKTSKEMKKQGPAEYQIPKTKTDKAGVNSPIGSK